MKKSQIFMLVAASSVALTSCSKLGKLGAENFNVTPTPLEAIGGQVPATINGTFPTKYMKKKATVTVIPVLKYEGGEAIGQSATFQGEKVEGNGTTYQAIGSTQTNLVATLNTQSLEDLSNAKKIKIDLGVSTNDNDQHVSIMKDDFLKMRAYVKLHPSATFDIPIVIE